MHIKFYSQYDLSLSTNYERALKDVDKFTSTDLASLEDVCRWYNIQLIFDTVKMLLLTEDAEFTSHYEKVKQVVKLIGKFVNSLDPNNLQKEYERLHREYREDFWQIFEKYDNNKLSQTIIPILDTFPGDIDYVLRCKGIVKSYDRELSTWIKEHPQTVELLLPYYSQYQRETEKKIYIPRLLTKEDNQKLIDSYLESGKTEGNILQLIQFFQDTSELSVTPDQKLKAKRINKERLEALFTSDSDSGICSSYTVGYDMTPDADPVKYSMKGLDLEIMFGGEFLLSLNDSDKIKVCKLLFGWVDSQDRITLLANRHNDTILEKINTSKSSKIYPVNMSFNQSSNLSLALLISYNQFLREKASVSIEELCKKFYEDYFQKEYGFKGISLNIPVQEENIINRCRSLCSEIESVAKQYHLYVTKGEVDPELLALQRPVKYGEISSLLQPHYVVAKEDSKLIQYSGYLMDSDQSPLYTMGREDNDLSNQSFIERLKAGPISRASGLEYMQQHIQWLIDLGLISVDRSGDLYLDDLQKIEIILELYRHGFITEPSYTADRQEFLMKLIDSGDVMEDYHLLSPQEVRYYNYYLNADSCTNGYNLRNLYLHGTPPAHSREIEYEYDYNHLLRLLIILLLKIDTDLKTASPKR